MSINIELDFVSKFNTIGSESFYNWLLSNAIFKAAKRVESKDKKTRGPSPEIELLNQYDYFLTLYRKRGEPIHLEIAILCRKAAHKIYRAMVKQNLTERNARFLNSVIK